MFDLVVYQTQISYFYYQMKPLLPYKTLAGLNYLYKWIIQVRAFPGLSEIF